MTISLVLTWVIIAWGALSCIYMLRCAWSRFPNRCIEDVVHFLYPVDVSLAEALLDPAAEFDFKWKLSPQEFREAQRRRMCLYLELVRRMSHNSRVLVEFGNSAINHQDATTAKLTSTLQQKAVEVRLYALLTQCRLRLWMWLRPKALGPVLPHLRKTASVDGLQTYSALKRAAAAAFVHLQPSELEALTRNL